MSKTKKNFKLQTWSEWAGLQRGDGVHLVAPASGCSAKTLRKIQTFLLSWGLQPFIPKDLMGGSDPLCAHTDSKRWLHLKRALQSSRSSVVWCIRGGYGSTRLLPLLSQLSPPKRFKLFVGMSDVTSLHVFFNQVWKWPVLHAPVLESLVGEGAVSLSQKGVRELQSLLLGQKKELRYPIVPVHRRSLQMFRAQARTSQKEKGLRLSAPLVGGNLTLLQSGLGTPWQIQPKGCILFIEDVNERAYRLDRIFQQFQQASSFHKVRALVLGDFVGAKEPGSLLNALFQQWAQKVPFPIFKGLPCGHGALQRPLPLGLKAHLLRSKTGREGMELVIS